MNESGPLCQHTWVQPYAQVSSHLSSDFAATFSSAGLRATAVSWLLPGVSVETLSICLNRGCRSFQRVTCCSGRARHRIAPAKRYAALGSQYREYLRQNSRPIGTKLMSHVPFVPWLSIYIYPPAFALHRLLSPLTTPNPSPRAELDHLGFSPELAFISITRSNKDPFRLGWKAEVSNEYAMKSVQRLSAGPCSSGLRHRNPPAHAWRFYVTEYSRV